MKNVAESFEQGLGVVDVTDGETADTANKKTSDAGVQSRAGFGSGATVEAFRAISGIEPRPSSLLHRVVVFLHPSAALHFAGFGSVGRSDGRRPFDQSINRAARPYPCEL